MISLNMDNSVKVYKLLFTSAFIKKKNNQNCFKLLAVDFGFDCVQTSC